MLPTGTTGSGMRIDMLFITMEYPDRRYAVLEYGSAFRWQEHYLLIQEPEEP